MSLTLKTVLFIAFQLISKSLRGLPDILNANSLQNTPLILTNPTLRYGRSGNLQHAVTCTIQSRSKNTLINQRKAHFELPHRESERTLKTTVFPKSACPALERDWTNWTGIKLSCLSRRNFGLPQCKLLYTFSSIRRPNMEIFQLKTNQLGTLRRHKKLTSH